MGRVKDEEGLLLLDKPSGPTSHDMVAATRKLLGGAKTGHTGTLDPLASGLLIVLAGRATRLAPYVRSDPKIYEGSMLLGLTTDSMDVEGTVTSETAYRGGPGLVRSALTSLIGEVEQIPPMYSAAKHRGRPLYSYARRGEEVEREYRRVRVYRAELTAFREAGDRAEADFLVSCSPGTYVRDLVSRVGDLLACGGVLSGLRRTVSGPFRIEEAMSLEELEEKAANDEAVLMPLEAALRGHRRIEVSEGALAAVRNGMPISSDMLMSSDDEIREGDIVAVFGSGELLGIHAVTALSPFSTRAKRMM